MSVGIPGVQGGDGMTTENTQLLYTLKKKEYLLIELGCQSPPNKFGGLSREVQE